MKNWLMIFIVIGMVFSTVRVFAVEADCPSGYEATDIICLDLPNGPRFTMRR